jgi:hypothetical protein
MENVKYIKLSNCERFTIVDAELYEELSKHRWRADFSKGKLKRVCRDRKKKDPPGNTRVHMHHCVITDIPAGMVVDHINHDTTDNRRANLRICTSRENSLNRGPQRNSKIPYKGVCIRKNAKKNPYRAIIHAREKYIELGRFDTAEKAARAYNKKAKELFGIYAYLNDVPEEDDAQIQANQ